MSFVAHDTSLRVEARDGLALLVEPQKGYVVYKEKVGSLSFLRARAGEHVCDAAIADMNGLTQKVKHLNKVARDLKSGKYGQGQRAKYTQLKRVRTGVDAEIYYTARIYNARIGDSLMIDLGGETVAEIRSETEGDIVVTFYLTSMGKPGNEARWHTNKEFTGGLQSFNIVELLGPVVPGKNDYISFNYLPKPENNLDNPSEKVRFRVTRNERLKVTGVGG